MFNFLLFSFIIYFFYKKTIATGKLQRGMQRVLPGVIKYLQNMVERLEKQNANHYRRNTGSNNRRNTNTMSVDEAYQILGVKKTASKDEIIKAFKKLMLTNHPDKGGSEYIAAKIIQAKKTLLGD